MTTAELAQLARHLRSQLTCRAQHQRPLMSGKSSLEFWQEFAEIHSLKERA
jgi:hypothetical protein